MSISVSSYKISIKFYLKCLGYIVTILSFAVILQAKTWNLGTIGSFAFAYLPAEDNNRYALGMVANSQKSCKVIFFIAKTQVKYPIDKVIFNVNGTDVNFVKLFNYKQALAYIPKNPEGMNFVAKQLENTNNLLIRIDNSTMNFNITNFMNTTKEVKTSCEELKKQFEGAL
ncbi:hypothetical protein HAV_00428 [Candidatus Hepatincola sp. Av]